MSKMNDLSLVVEELKKCGNALIGVSETLADLFSGSGEPNSKEETHATPETESITLETVRAALAEKSRAGFTAEVRDLLKKYGASKLSEIEPKKYKALLADAEVLGNG
ncbi:DNA ligase [Lachnospiraceae bacterium ZAX-1]